MRTQQEITARINYLHKEHRDIMDAQLLEYDTLATDPGSSRHIQSSGDRIAVNEAKIRHILEKINLLEWCIDNS